MPTGGRRRTSRGSSGERSRWLDLGPSWLQAIIAALALLVTVLTAYGLIGRPEPSSATPTSPGTAASVSPAAAPRVVVVAVREAPEVRGIGEFENLDLTLDGIYLLGIPAEGSGQEPVLVEGDVTSSAIGGGGLASGDWEAHRPAPATGLAWQAIVYPLALGAAGGLDDLRANGADAEGVKAASEVIEPET